MRLRFIITGFVIWLGATIALRLFGQHILRPGNPIETLFLFALTFPAMALLFRQVCLGAHMQPQQWLPAADSLLLPTLLLDPFSSALFQSCFPTWLLRWLACSGDGCSGAARAVW